MTKKKSARATATRGVEKAKSKKTTVKKTTSKTVARKPVGRKKPATKMARAAAVGTSGARRGAPTPSVAAWPGLPPGYFDRAH